MHRRLTTSYNGHKEQRSTKGKPDGKLFLLAITLTVLGVIAIADVSSPLALSTFKDSFYFAKQQGIWAVIGVSAMIVSSKTPYQFWKKIAPYFFGVTILLLILVLLPGLGTRVYGAKRWISFGTFGFQPAELVKLSLSMFFAYLFDRQAPLKFYFITLLAIGGLIMLEPDLGTTIIVLSIGFTQLFIAGIPFLIMFGAVLGGGLLGALLILTSAYRKARLLTYFQNSTDPLGSSYHIRQILIAIGSGGIFGVGLGHSRQKYLFLPETATDSVFAIISEEVGFVGSTILILALSYLVLKAIKIASRAPDRFSQLLAVGISAWLAAQMFFNIASMVALVPLTGIPLPFFSYGGTSLTVSLFAIGILLNISKYAKQK